MAHREYSRTVFINGRVLKRVIISDHYEEKHKEHMSDTLILKLIDAIRSEDIPLEATLSDGHEVYVANNVVYGGKKHRLVLTLHPSGHYLGVINAFRRRGK